MSKFTASVHVVAVFGTVLGSVVAYSDLKVDAFLDYVALDHFFLTYGTVSVCVTGRDTDQLSWLLNASFRIRTCPPECVGVSNVVKGLSDCL